MRPSKPDPQPAGVPIPGAIGTSEPGSIAAAYEPVGVLIEQTGVEGRHRIDPAAISSPVRALVIEPDAHEANAVAHTIVGVGYVATTVATAREAFDAIAREANAAPPDAADPPIAFTTLFISESLHDMDPLDCFHRLRRRLPGCSGVLLSAAADVNTVFSAVTAGFQSVLAKPVDPVELLPLLSS